MGFGGCTRFPLLRWEKGSETPSCGGKRGLRLPRSLGRSMRNEGVSDPFSTARGSLRPFFPPQKGKPRTSPKSLSANPLSATHQTSVLRRGGPGMLVRPLSFLSISARLVLALIRLLMRGLKDEPSVSAAPRACTCPTTRSSPNGRRGPPIPDSTMPLGPVRWYWGRPFRGKNLCMATYL